MKAFVINVIGDVGLVFAAFFIFRELGTLRLPGRLQRGAAARSTPTRAWWSRSACCSASARSRSPPSCRSTPGCRTRWRARRPVSALIHAATMVTAGVYLIARMCPLFELAPTAADIAAFVGLATLLFAGTIALAVTDLKRIIAYST